MRIPLDRDSAVPLYRQICRFLHDEIRSGARLPASRSLAAGLGVGRLTVTNAYAELEAEGLIYQKQGSGAYVAPSPAALAGPGLSPVAGWPLWQQELLGRA